MIFAVEVLLLGHVSVGQRGVVLSAAPGKEVSSALGLWSPSFSEHVIVFSLEIGFHLRLFLWSWQVLIECTILEERQPHECTILIIISNGIPLCLIHHISHFSLIWILLNEGPSLISLFLSNLPLQLICKLHLKHLILGILLELGLVLGVVQHI